VRASDVLLPAPEVALARGTALGRFVILGLVGRGAMGEVYGAYDPDLDRKIAIKLVRASAGGAGDGSDGRARLMREAQATAKVAHPNVVVVYDAGTFGDRVFIAMEFVEGHTLRYWLQERGRSVAEILDTFLAAGRGLAAAHEKELVHRDFKPDNVMVGAGGQVRVMDFGLARVADATAVGAPEGPPAAAMAASAVPALAGEPLDLDATSLLGAPFARAPVGTATQTITFNDKITATGTLLGTPAYMSPEQFQGHLADARSDQFTFCVALFEALFGARPFFGRTMEELARNVVGGNLVEPPSSRRVPTRVRKALETGLRVDPRERFPSMNALLAELEKAAGAGRGGFAAHAAAKLAGVWEAPVGGEPVVTLEKEAIRQAFLATGRPHAAASFANASATLDRYTERWTELYVEICEATHVRGEQSAEILDLRMAFLTEGLDDLKALCRLFRDATPEVVSNADKAASALANLERCRDIAFIRNAVRPPQDFEVRAAVENLRAELAEVRALMRVGRVSDGLRAIAPLVEEARRVAYDPVLAEALLLNGSLEYESTHYDRAIAVHSDAFSVAQLARHDEVAAEAALHVMGLEGYANLRFDVAEVWGRCAEALLGRMRSHDLLWGWYFNNRASMRQMQGRLADAIADARLAVEAKTRALGPRTFDVALSLANLANHMAYAEDFVGAVEDNRRALAILHEAIGPDHPWSAIALANQSQYLFRLGRFDEALDAASRALAHFEREGDPTGYRKAFPLRTLGLCYLALGRLAEARATLERAVSIREALEKTPLRLGEVHFPLARALYETGERSRALALARKARREYEHAPKDAPLGEGSRRARSVARGAHPAGAPQTRQANKVGIAPETSPSVSGRPTAFIAEMTTFAGYCPVAATCWPGLSPPARPAMRQAMFSVECVLFCLPVAVSRPWPPSCSMSAATLSMSLPAPSGVSRSLPMR
jgi:tetratricopeptide (TPR) repeat protein